MPDDIAALPKQQKSISLALEERLKTLHDIGADRFDLDSIDFDGYRDMARQMHGHANESLQSNSNKLAIA